MVPVEHANDGFDGSTPHAFYFANLSALDQAA
jgi:hypothetical protein